MQQIDFNIKSNQLLEKSRVVITAEASIIKYLTIDNLIVILVSAEELKNDKNIFGYDLDGKFKWQISEPDKLHFTNKYTSIYIAGDGNLMAYNENGVEVTIDKLTGQILKKELIK